MVHSDFSRWRLKWGIEWWKRSATQNQARRRSTFWATWVTSKFQSNQIANRIFVFIFCINMIWKKIILIKYHNITWNRKRIDRLLSEIDGNHTMIQPINFQLKFSSFSLIQISSKQIVSIFQILLENNDRYRSS